MEWGTLIFLAQTVKLGGSSLARRTLLEGFLEGCALESSLLSESSMSPVVIPIFWATFWATAGGGSQT